MSIVEQLRARLKRPAAPQDADAIRWLYFDTESLEDHRGVVDQVFKRSVDGMSIKGVFAPDEIMRVLDALPAIVDDRHDQTFGHMFGMPLNQVGANDTDLTPFLDSAAATRPIFRDLFGFDPHDRIRSTVEALTALSPVMPPTIQGREGNPGNIRSYAGGKGGLRAHAGNEFVDLLSQGAMSELLRCTQVIDHVSYFVVLQRPESGGQLSVYDVLWDDLGSGDNHWDAGRRDSSVLAGHIPLKIDPEPGELIVFGGGWRWHRVDEVVGDTPRITYGGFMGPSRDDDNALHAWC